MSENFRAEEWRPVLGYEGIYSVSDIGRVCRAAGGRGAVSGRLVRPKLTAKGYLYAELSVADRKRRIFVHQLVARAFLGEPPSHAHVVNHRNGIKTCNEATNLEWCTRAENNRHAARTGLHRALPGEQNGRARLTAEQAAEIRRLKGHVSQREIARRFGVVRTTVQWIHQGKHWRVE